MRLPFTYTKVKESEISGEGLFAQKQILRYQLVITMNNIIDVNFNFLKTRI